MFVRVYVGLGQKKKKKNFFFKQKAAYEFCSSDCSSVVCSSDLGERLLEERRAVGGERLLEERGRWRRERLLEESERKRGE